MRLRYPSNESVIDNSGALGIELTFVGPLELNGDPIENKDTSNKGYVDRGFISLDASKLTQSTLSIERIPEFIGDTINTEGTNVFTLVPSGINPGSHVKVTVDAKGRVVSSSGINLSDIPDFSWEKITRNKPTTLEGYGVTDGIKTSGDLVPNGIISDVEPNQDLHAATKSYIENLPDNGSSINTGAIIAMSSDITPANFLRVNGGEVSKAAYAELYSVLMSNVTSTIRLDYTSYAAMGAGQPWKQQYDFKVSSNADITGWSADVSLPGALSSSQAIVTKNRVYLLGGSISSAAGVSTVYTAPINIDGTLGTWTQGTSLPGGLRSSQAIVTKNRVYLLGGYSGNYTATVYTAPINTDGTLGAWTTGTSLPVALSNSQAVVTKNRVYLLGGHNGTSAVATVYTAPINVDGTLGTWATGTSLPGGLSQSQAIVTKNRVYLLGGAGTSIIYTAPINTDGTLGAWAIDSNLPGNLASTQAIVTKNRVYLIGGSSNVAYTAPINEDGTLGTWTNGNGLPVTLGTSQAIVTKNRVYLLAGSNSSTIYTAPLPGNEPLSDYSKFYDGSINKFDNSDLSGNIVIQQGDVPYDISLQPGSGKPWKQQYEFNTSQSTDITGWTTGTSLPIMLFDSQAIVTKNRVYLLGGRNGGGFLNTVYTAPINEDGTLGAWVTGTSLPGALAMSQAIVTKNRVYLLGGAGTSIIYTAPINTDGTLGAWATGTSLPGTLAMSQAIVTKNRVYLLGGYGSSTVSTVYTAPINEDGTLGTWTAGTDLPGALHSSQAIVTKNRVYLLGGSNGYYVNTVYTAPINEDGTLGVWSTGTILPGTLAMTQAIVTKNRVYLTGGGGSAANTVYTAPITEDGTLGTWVTGTPLPSIVASSQAIMTKNRVYLLGGVNSDTVYTAPFSGGLNDYSPYYDGTITPTDPNNFKLPDYSKLETITEKYYIKY